MRRHLTENGVQRVLEMQAELNRNPARKYSFDEVVELAIRLQYNRRRAVRRHSLSLKNVPLEVSPLEERGMRGTDDE